MEKTKDQVKLKRVSGRVGFGFIFPINVEFVRSGTAGRGQWVDGRG